MPTLFDVINSKLRVYYSYFLIAFIIILFVVTTLYLYNTMILPMYKKNNLPFKDVANNNSEGNELSIRMFHVEWCPHCRTALPNWQAFCDKYNNTNVNGYIIKCDRNGYDCTDDEDPKVKATVSDYNITSFPTVILFKDNERYDFDAKITRYSLEQFVQSVTV